MRVKWQFKEKKKQSVFEKQNCGYVNVYIFFPFQSIYLQKVKDTRY